MWEFLEAASEYFVIEIYSTRSETQEGRDAMKAWFEDHADTTERSDIAHRILRFPPCKPKAFVGLDDRILTFEGKWPEISTLINWKPWNKRQEFNLEGLPSYRNLTLSLTNDQLEDLRTLLFQEKRSGMVTGGSSVAAESKRRRDTFEHLYNQLPPGRAPDVGQS